MFGRWSVLVALMCWLAGWAGSAAGRDAALHPQDGPHADIRIVVSDRDVRMTLGINLPFLDEAVQTNRETNSGVAESEEPAVLKALEKLIATDTEIIIDGELVAPTIERLDIERLSEDSLYLFPNSGRAALTRFNAVAVYPCDSPPQSVKVRWSHYPASALSSTFEDVGDTPPPMVIDAQFRAEGRVRIMRFSETDPVQTWRAGGDTPETAIEALPPVEIDRGTAMPVLSLVLVVVGVASGSLLVMSSRRGLGVAIIGIGIGAALATRSVGVMWVGRPGVSDADATRMFAILHSNIYRAFDFTAENDIYDTLSLSVTGDLLDSLYKQIRLGLVQAENGGGVGRVTALDLRSVQLIGTDRTQQGVAFEVYAEWDVEGTVYHFGHSHAKTSPYAGVFRVAQTADGWRIDEAEPQQRAGLFVAPEQL